jgi:hypothetical protein
MTQRKFRVNQITPGALSDGTYGVTVVGGAITGFGAAGGGSALVRQDFTATAAQTAFTLSVSDPDVVLVTRTGLALDPADYAVSGTTLTLDFGADAGDGISVFWNDGSGGGGGGGGSTVQDPRWTNPDSTPHAQDREFRSDSDLTGFVRVDNSTNNAQAQARSTWSRASDSLHVWNDGSLGHTDAAGEMHGYMWPYALAVGEALQGHIVLNGIQQAYAWAGICVSDGVTFASGTQILWSHWHATDLEGNLQDGIWTGWNTRSAFTDRSRALTYGTNPLHFRLVRDTSNVWRYQVSSDAKNWTEVATRTQALTTSHIGFATGMWGSSSKHGFAFDYLRVVTP